MDATLTPINEAIAVKDLTIAEASKVLRVSRQTLMTWIGDEKIAANKSEGVTAPWLIPALEVERVRLERIAELQAEIDELSVSVEEFLR